RETRQQQIYELVVDKGGSKLRETADTSRGEGIGGGNGELLGIAADIPVLTYVLSQRLGRSVIDKTGLTGKYDFKLTWTSDAAWPATLGADSPVSSGESGPTLFTAIQQDLGLKLQAAKGPVETLVIDRAEKPDAN